MAACVSATSTSSGRSAASEASTSSNRVPTCGPLPWVTTRSTTSAVAATLAAVPVAVRRWRVERSVGFDGVSADCDDDAGHGGPSAAAR